MNMKEASKPSRIPEFASIQEEAQFWDTHSTADYEDEFKPVQVRFAKNLSQGITIRLDTVTLDKVRALAKSKGMGPATLIRMWVLERLQQDEALPRVDAARKRKA
ncbi:MAG: hypothetical protein EXR46_04540 [Dehalococcoidia bacterium]|nr:hypothetical protein [Dehalococcoidia bacterium]